MTNSLFNLASSGYASKAGAPASFADFNAPLIRAEVTPLRR
jgi:hypothetical protein